MKVLVTGASGFIGKNLVLYLKEENHEVLEYDVDTNESLENLITKCDFVMHLAGINRPLSAEEFYDGNTNLTFKLIDILNKQGRDIPLLLSSSIQAAKDNDYGKSKKMAEDLVFEYGEKYTAYIYRLANVFGKWCRPNYNSVVATFCYNTANNIYITINDPFIIIPFVYIDDVCKAFVKCIGGESSNSYLKVEPEYKVSIGDLAKTLKMFKQSRENLNIMEMKDGFEKKLYSTYLSYLKEDEFSYKVKMNVDERGSFTEMFKSEERGQVSVNIIKPGIVKGQHWHHSKNEKFVVVSGKAVIRFRKINTEKVIEYIVSGVEIEVVDIPTGYTHNIENIGQEECICVMWANECFDPNNPDTFYEKV
jgi:UDP-2-acetamido-2,6-beta-L-arabino-hexul-4-ose reductase